MDQQQGQSLERELAHFLGLGERKKTQGGTGGKGLTAEGGEGRPGGVQGGKGAVNSVVETAGVGQKKR